MENLCDVLVRPVITEKSNLLMEENKYTFIVSLKANEGGNPPGCGKNIQSPG